MQATIPRIRALHSALERELFTIRASWDYAKVTHAIDLLARMVEAYDGPTEAWAYIGEFGHATVSDLIPGAFWHYTEWHSGQWSIGYKALSALGMVFKPGYTSGPESHSSEFDVYKALDRLARKDAGMPVYSFVPVSL